MISVYPAADFAPYAVVQPRSVGFVTVAVGTHIFFVGTPTLVFAPRTAASVFDGSALAPV